GYDYINPTSIINKPATMDIEEFLLFNKKQLIPQPVYNPNVFYEKESTNLAIGGKKTNSRFPMLANFTTGKLELPNRWYEMQISSDMVDLYGITLPGVPVIIEGFGKDFAWSIATTNRDMKDYYRLTLNPFKKSQYWYDNHWKEAIYEVESILIKGEKPCIDTVFYSVWGPITFDPSLTYNNTSYGYATNWLLHDTTHSDILPYYALNLSKSYEDFEMLVNTFTGMNLNITFVDKTGKIGNVQTGNLSAKWYAQGDFILPGENNLYKTKKIPTEQNISIVNPINNFIVTTNQIPADKRYPYYLGRRFDIYRSALFNGTIPTFDEWDFFSLKLILSNTYNPFAKKVMEDIFFPNIDRATLSAEVLFVFDSLKKWDYTDNSPFSKVVFNKWWQLFYDNVISSLQLELKDTLMVPLEDITLVSLYENFKIKKSTISSSFVSIAKDIANSNRNNSQWYRSLTQFFSKHIVSDLTSLTSYNTYGSRYSILPYDNHVGVTWRMIVDISDKGKAWGMLFGGQSGNPGSFYYESNIADWNKQVYYPLTMYGEGDMINGDYNRLIFKK
ncbi:MAG: penicillin acylase family protein, partial [Chitinophagaceae bacterium]